MYKAILIFLLFATLGLKAQSTEKWNLQRCIDYALEHNTAIQQNSLQGVILANNLQQKIFELGDPDPNALIDSLELLTTNDLRSDLYKVDVETLIISGGRDKIIPPTASVYMAEKISGASLEIFENANHLPFLTEKHRFVDTVLRFIK